MSPSRASRCPTPSGPGAKALIIGPGGGWDVARALASGSHDITAVEINPIIAETIMQERFPQLSRNLYHRPDVHVHVEDGRSFVRRSTDKYQVIQATLVDTWASTAAGAFALSENNLYTTDAFRDYLSHLTDDGLIAFGRWGFEPPRESLRLISLAMEALAPARRDRSGQPRDRRPRGRHSGLGRPRHRPDFAQAVSARRHRTRQGALRRGEDAGRVPARRAGPQPVLRPAPQPGPRRIPAAATPSTSARSATTGRSSSIPCSRATCGIS